jgi:hypothetical protein
MMFPDATEEELRLALLICNKYGLDPLLRHVVLIKQRERDGQPAKRNLYVTRDGLLHVAHVSGKLNGIVLEKQEETPAEWRAVISVYRKDMDRPFTYPGRYPKSGSNARYGPEMAVKVAEVMALRRAFDVALPAREERTDFDDEEILPAAVVNAETGEITESASVPFFDTVIQESRKNAIGRLNKAFVGSGLGKDDLRDKARQMFGRPAIDSIADLSDQEVALLADEVEALVAATKGAAS